MYILLKTPCFSPPSIFGPWNWASSVGGRKKREFTLFSFALSAFAFFLWRSALLLFALFFSRFCALFCFTVASAKARKKRRHPPLVVRYKQKTATPYGDDVIYQTFKTKIIARKSFQFAGFPSRFLFLWTTKALPSPLYTILTLRTSLSSKFVEMNPTPEALLVQRTGLTSQIRRFFLHKNFITSDNDFTVKCNMYKYWLEWPGVGSGGLPGRLLGGG